MEGNLKYNKGLFLIIGECFRKGNQHTRVRGVPEAFDDQKKACFSHVDLIDFLEKKHSIKIDVILNSYSTRYDKNIVEWYKNNIIKYNFFPHPIGYKNIYETGIDLIDNREYDFIFVCRVDLFLKKYFKKVFDIKKNKIVFPLVMPFPLFPSLPWISETMMFVSKDHFNLFFDKKIFLNHDLLNINNQILNKIDYFVNTYHFANSSNGWNPIYRMTNRKECRVWGRENFIVGTDYKPIFDKTAGKDYFLVKHL